MRFGLNWGSVKSTAVLDGLILGMFAWLSLGIMARATLLLNGPTIANTSASAIKESALIAP